MFGSLLNGGTISAGDGAYAIKAAALKGSSGDSDVGLFVTRDPGRCQLHAGGRDDSHAACVGCLAAPSAT